MTARDIIQFAFNTMLTACIENEQECTMLVRKFNTIKTLDALCKELGKDIDNPYEWLVVNMLQDTETPTPQVKGKFIFLPELTRGIDFKQWLKEHHMAFIHPNPKNAVYVDIKQAQERLLRLAAAEQAQFEKNRKLKKVYNFKRTQFKFKRTTK